MQLVPAIPKVSSQDFILLPAQTVKLPDLELVQRPGFRSKEKHVIAQTTLQLLDVIYPPRGPGGALAPRMAAEEAMVRQTIVPSYQCVVASATVIYLTRIR